VITDPARPLVSVVTPSFDQGKYVGATVESVLAQDYPNIDYWVIDGGSTDDTERVLRSFEGDPRFHWVSEKDRGHADAVNKGWGRSRGQILGWLNSDDTYLPGAISTQVGALLARPDADIVYGDAVFTDADGRRLGTYWGRAFSQYQQLRYSCVPQPTAFCRRGIVERAGPLDLSLKLALDVEYWLRASLFGSIVHVPGEIATYRLHDASATVTQVTTFNQYVLQIVDGFYARDDIPHHLREHRDRIYADLMLASGMRHAKVGQIAEAMNYLRRSWDYGSLRPRQIPLLMTVFDAMVGSSLGQRLMDSWAKLRH
jgi:GT2 family glycosyltransferase